jgi:outer membrane protein OmpA-like peptidoglycan-associated protein
MPIRESARWLSLALLAGLAMVSNPSSAEAQFGRRLKDAVKRTAEDKAINKATEEESKAIDKAAAGGGDSAANDSAAPASAPATAGEATEAASTEGSADPTAAPAAPKDRKIWANYDFVPGQRTLFYADFTEDQVGNFPQRLEYKTGSMEIVEYEGGQRALKASSTSDLIIPLPEVLPERFTIELDVVNRNSRGVASNTFEIAGGRDGLSQDKYNEIGWGHNGLSVTGGPVQTEVGAKDEDIQRYVGKPASFRILGDGKYLKLYADEKRIANIPNADFRRDKALFLRLEARDDQDQAVYVTRIRVAESQKTIYDALKAEGRWATQGILFDTGKSEVKPESTPTLKQIAAALKEHPELKVEIQGHTDNVGKADGNLKLSQARADAVKAALTGEYGVGAEQLAAKGYGDTKPAADNKSAEGRANNRRVELVKM